MSINQISVIGNLGDDPKMTMFDDGNKVVKLKVATNSSWKDKRTGEKKEETEWHTAYLRNRLAEVAQDYLKKGDKVYISGKMRCRKYINEKDETHWITEIHGSKMLMISTGRSNKGQSGNSEQAYSNPMTVEDNSNVNVDSTVVASKNESAVEIPASDQTSNHDSNTAAQEETVSSSVEQPTVAIIAPDTEEKSETQSGSDGSTAVDKVDSPTAVDNEDIHEAEEFIIDDSDIEIDCSEDVTDEFNRKALEASEQDDKADISDLPSWLIP